MRKLISSPLQINSMDLGVLLQAINWRCIQLRSTAQMTAWEYRPSYWPFISKMYFSHWKPSGVSKRMWSVNLDASISWEYQTQQGIPAGLRSNWDLWWLVLVYHGTDCDQFENTLECRRELWVHLGAPWCAGDKSGSTDDQSGSADAKSRSADNESGSANDKSGSADDKTWSADDMSANAHNMSRSANDKPGSTWERLRQASEHFESLYSGIGTTTSSLGALLLHLEIIATTYHSTIFKTHVFSFYSLLLIFTATHLHTVYVDWPQAVLESNLRCSWKWWLSEHRETLRGRDRASVDMHLEAMIGWVCTCTCKP